MGRPHDTIVYEVEYPDNRQEGSPHLLAYFRTYSSAVNFARYNKGKWRRKLCSPREYQMLGYQNKLGP